MRAMELFLKVMYENISICNKRAIASTKVKLIFSEQYKSTVFKNCILITLINSN